MKYASDCEVCKVLATEFEARMSETGRTHDVVETGYSHTKEKKKTKYVTSELRLIETMDGICDRILEYNIHKERKDSTRFAKGQSETFSTLEGLVAKGVKVDIGIPHELWNKPSAEVTQLKTQCEVNSTVNSQFLCYLTIFICFPDHDRETRRRYRGLVFQPAGPVYIY